MKKFYVDYTTSCHLIFAKFISVKLFFSKKRVVGHIAVKRHDRYNYVN